MEKPLSLKKKEFINQLVNVINDTDIPLFVIENILQATISEVHVAAIKQAKQEEEAYIQSCAEIEKSEVIDEVETIASES